MDERVMNISRDEARRIADLAHLEFDEASLDRLAAEMTKILGYIERLPTDGTAGARETSADESTRAGSPAAPLREDVIAATLNLGDFFVVPKVIE